MKNDNDGIDAVEAARQYGIDISLLVANLKRTPTERIQRLQEWQELYEELRKVNPLIKSRAVR